jgi:hypothetical protein
MRGSDERSGSLFSYVDLEARVRADHPLRVIRSLANAALVDLSVEFDKLYTDFGRLSIAPEKLLRAMLLQVFYGVRSGSDKDHDGPGRNAERSFHKERRSNETHESTTDPEARLYKKGDGQPAKLCYMGHALMENRNGLVVLGGVSQANGTAEREIALAMIDRRGCTKRVTLGADKAYDVTQFVHDLRDRSVTPHIAIDGHLSKTGKRRKTAIDARTTRHDGYDISQRCRKRIEEVFGWIKSSAGLAKVKLRGRDRVDAIFILALAAYNLIRLPKLLAAPA